MIIFLRYKERKEVFTQDETVELEMDELNQHECMANMTALLRHMQGNNITPKVEEVCNFSFFNLFCVHV